MRDDWREKTPAEIRYGCALSPAAAVIWGMFAMLHRHRVTRFDGSPAPLQFADMHAAARMVRDDFDAATIVRIFAALDGDVFEHGSRVNAINISDN